MKSRIILFAFCLALLSGCGKKGFDLSGGTPECAVKELKPATVDLKSSYPATIKGKQDVEIRPQVSGFITKVCVDEGSMVRKGQVLFIIDPVQYEAAERMATAAVATAEANVNTQQITYDNKVALNRKNIISDYDLKMAENSLASAKAQLASAKAQQISARQNLGFTSVKSPSDGIVNNIPYRLGSLVSPSIQTPMTVVSDINEMYVYASLTEKDLLSLVRKDGTQQSAVETYPEVELQLSDGTIYGDKGKMSTISGVINQNTGAVSIRATFPNGQHLLRSGGMANLVIPYHLENAITIPQKATTELQDKKFVFILGADNKVKMTEITVFNVDNGHDYVVTSGLKAGDKIVLDNASTLKDGQEIKPVSQAEANATFQKTLEEKKNEK
ncbi:efflux RND transporter periplasmic adaptor subunit [Bacteroides sp.]